MATPRYTATQMAAGRAVSAALIVCVVSILVARQPNTSFDTALLGVVIVLALAAAMFEGLARLLALLFGLIRRPLSLDHTMAGAAAVAAALLESPALPDRDAGAAAPVRLSHDAVLPAANFRFRDALACFGWWIAAETGVWVAIGVIAGIRTGPNARGGELTAEVMRMAVAGAPLSLALGALALVLVIRRLQRRYPGAQLQQELGLSFGPGGEAALAALGGILLAVAFVAVAPLLPTPSPTDGGPLRQLAVRSRSGWLAFSVAALMAAPVEEVMFRGVLLRGFRAVAGVPVAALAAGFAFWLMHVPEFGAYWPAAVAIALLTTFVTMLRLRFRSVGPGIAAHFGYNLTIASVMYFGVGR
jgi:membrane protease YdiL (CAAX protease family)